LGSAARRFPYFVNNGEYMKKFLVLVAAALLFVSCNEDYDYGYSDPWSFSEPTPAAAPAPKVEPKPETPAPKPAPAPRTTDGVRSMTTSEGVIVLETKFYSSRILMLMEIPENEKAVYKPWRNKKYAIAEIKYVDENGSYRRELQVYTHYESAKRHFDD
jgi:hypothetical protein